MSSAATNQIQESPHCRNKKFNLQKSQRMLKKISHRANRSAKRDTVLTDGIENAKARFINLRLIIKLQCGKNISKNLKLSLRLQITEKVYQKCLKHFIKSVKLFIKIRINGSEQIIRSTAKPIQHLEKESWNTVTRKFKWRCNLENAFQKIPTADLKGKLAVNS